MRAPSNLNLAGIFFLSGIVLLVLIATHKTNETIQAPTHYNDDTVSKYIDEAERQNERERDQKEQANKLANLAKAKKDSVECQFWQLQKQNKSTNTHLDEKITHFCELPPEQAANIISPPAAL